jgi:hypothetical protein
MYIFSLQLDLLTAALHQAPTLIDCQIFKDHSYPTAALRFRFAFATASSFAASDKSFCLSAAEKRDYEAVFCCCQHFISFYFRNSVLTYLPQLLTTYSNLPRPASFIAFRFRAFRFVSQREANYSKTHSPWQEVCEK